jgi:hypothetical protein
VSIHKNNVVVVWCVVVHYGTGRSTGTVLHRAQSG